MPRDAATVSADSSLRMKVPMAASSDATANRSSVHLHQLGLSCIHFTAVVGGEAVVAFMISKGTEPRVMKESGLVQLFLAAARGVSISLCHSL